VLKMRRRHFTPSLPGLTRQSILLCKKMDARVTSAFTRVFDALLPAHDESKITAVRMTRTIPRFAGIDG